MKQSPYACDFCCCHIEEGIDDMFIISTSYISDNDWHFCGRECLNSFYMPDVDTRFDEDA